MFKKKEKGEIEMAMAIDMPSPSPSASAAAAAGRRLGEEEQWRRFGEEEDGWWGGQAAAGEGTGKTKNEPVCIITNGRWINIYLSIYYILKVHETSYKHS
jgi:hypothetical protein